MSNPPTQNSTADKMPDLSHAWKLAPDGGLRSTDLVRFLVPDAPDIGVKTKICLGRTKGGFSCVVGGEADHRRTCEVMGYVIQIGHAATVKPCDAETVNVMVKVRLSTALNGSREGMAHVSCLVAVSKSNV